MSGQGTSVADDIIGALRAVTRTWTRQRKQEERQVSARLRRSDRMFRRRIETVKKVAWEVMEKAYLAASNNDTLPATARQVMYAARPEIQDRTGRKLDDQYFCQQLLPDYIEEQGVDWDVVFDDRGHFREPHTDHEVQFVVAVPWFWQYVSRLCTAAVQSLQLAHVYTLPFDSLYWIDSHVPELLVVHSW